ncbi:hypothetical protein ABW19_dt0204352 [Dactylella cylindrospora]|nr:hypothetical protein ABW19_dt0204352 [Dactylella cylindrospora]
MNFKIKSFTFLAFAVATSQAIRPKPDTHEYLAHPLYPRASNTSSASSCQCGYYIPESKLTFTHHLSINPTSLTTANVSRGLSSQGWNISNYLLPSKPNISYISSNVRLNSVSKTLDLYVSGGAPSRSSVNSAEIGTILDSIRYGSFRFTVKTSRVAGACNGMFFYQDDNREIDIELLTSHLYSSTNKNNGAPKAGIQLSVQPLTTNQTKLNYKTAPFKTLTRSTSIFDPTKGYHQYRFDWSRSKVVYYVDGYANGLYWRNLPVSASGQILVNNWSNGDPYWSGGPPLRDSILSIKRVDLYFNSTDPAEIRAFETRCKNSSSKQACTINKSSSA